MGKMSLPPLLAVLVVLLVVLVVLPVVLVVLLVVLVGASRCVWVVLLVCIVVLRVALPLLFWILGGSVVVLVVLLVVVANPKTGNNAIPPGGRPAPSLAGPRLLTRETSSPLGDGLRIHCLCSRRLEHEKSSEPIRVLSSPDNLSSRSRVAMRRETPTVFAWYMFLHKNTSKLEEDHSRSAVSVHFSSKRHVKVMPADIKSKMCDNHGNSHDYDDQDQQQHQPYHPSQDR